MDSRQFPHVTPPHLRPILEGGPSPGHDGILAQTLDRPNHPPETISSRLESDLRFHFECATHLAPTSLLPHPQAVYSHTQRRTIGSYAQENAFSDRQRQHMFPPTMPTKVADSNELPHTTTSSDEVEISTDYTAGSWPSGVAQPPFDGVPNHTFLRSLSRSDSEQGLHAAAMPIDHASTPSDRVHLNHHPRMQHLDLSVPPHPLDPTPEHPTFPFSRPLMGPATAYEQQQSNDAVALTGAGGQTTGPLGHAELLDPRRPRNGDAREGGTDLPCHPTRVQHPGGHGKANKAMLPRKRRCGRKSCDPTTPVLGAPDATRGSREFKAIPQIVYKSKRDQHGWVRQPPIDFGFLRLVDTENPNYIGPPVLKYLGVGSSITSRLDFSGYKIEKKILTTNNKGTPEQITMHELALRIAKLVQDHIATIRKQPGCSDVTFERMVLRRMHHVSRASWQPELLLELTPPGCNSS